MPLVVIEVDAHDAPASLARTLVEACSGAIPQGDCRFDEPPGEVPVAVATVKWDGKGEHRVRIEVGTKRRGEPEWLGKTLEFRGVDPRPERWRSVGLTIATLVRELSAGAPPSTGTAISTAATAEAQGGAATSSSAEAASGPAGATASDAAPSGAAGATVAKPTEVPPANTPPGDAADDEDDEGPAKATHRAVRTPLWLDAGILAGPAFTGGDAKVGGLVALGAQFASPIFGRLSFSYEVHPPGSDALSAHFSTITVGAGAAIPFPSVPLTFEPRLAILAEYLDVSARDAQGRTDDTGQFSSGLHAGASLVWELPAVSPFLGGEGYWRGAPTDILLENQVIATIPGASWSVQAGLRFFL